MKRRSLLVKFGRGLVSAGTPIGAYDLQIAAIALVNNLTLVNLSKHNQRLEWFESGAFLGVLLTSIAGSERKLR